MDDRKDKTDWKPEWKDDRVFEDGPVVVVVLKSNHRTPAYRLMVSFSHGGRRLPSYQPRFEMKDDVVETDRTIDARIAKLWSEALTYATEQYQKNEDAWRARRARQNGTPGQRPGLKALAKQDKKKWQERQDQRKIEPPPDGAA